MADINIRELAEHIVTNMDMDEILQYVEDGINALLKQCTYDELLDHCDAYGFQQRIGNMAKQIDEQPAVSNPGI